MSVAAPSEVRVHEAVSKSDLQSFIDLPWSIYKDDALWVPPLKADVKGILDEVKNPFWQHAERKLFLAEQDGEVVGRIAAIHCSLHNEVHQDGAGFFGFFESINDKSVSAALFDTAAGWLAGRGCRVMRGPMNPSLNDEAGLLVEGFDRAPAIMFTRNPEYYVDLVESAGFKKAKDFYVWDHDIEGASKKFEGRVHKIVERIRKRPGLTVRTFEMKHFARDVAIIRDLYNRCWEKNWGFVPMTDAEFKHMAEQLKPILEPKGIVFVEMDGKPVSMSLCLPDFNRVLKHLNGNLGPVELVKFFWYKRKIDWCRLVILGILPEYRKKGLDLLMIVESIKNAVSVGWKGGDLGWTLEDNDEINNGIKAVGSTIVQRHRIYDRPLAV